MKPLPGIIGKLCEKVGRPGVAVALGIAVKELEALAHNRTKPGSDVATRIKLLCDKHEIERMLYVTRGRVVKDVFIASTASGWVSWTLKRGWHLRSRYIGGTTNDLLEPVSKETLALARAQGWPG